MEENTQELTFGMKAVGINFNPSGDPVVYGLKVHAANFIDACKEIENAVKNNPEMFSDEAKGEIIRMSKIAITEAQTAQMWAVKAATWKG